MELTVPRPLSDTASARHPAIPRVLWMYVWIVAGLGIGPLVWSIATLAGAPPDTRWLLLVGVTILSSALRVRVPSVRATVSVSDGFVFASALLFGPAAATLTVALEGLIVSWWNRDRSLHQALFNVCEPAVSVWTSAQLYYALSGASPIVHATGSMASLVVPIVTMTTAYFALNAGLTAVAVALETGEAPRVFLRKHLPHLGLNYVASVCLLTILMPNASSLGAVAIGVTVPLLLMSYVSSKTTMTHIEETNRHLSEMNRLYIRIVDTLAVAIDAKDQVTHGHIRRVQAQAVALARALGVRDEREVRAIEAAGLLHDLGKLAVPEHVLNKPGALTSAEFEQMKTHASIGAAILATIDFPYPVVPIVRHHHEAWDGSGYPDGLAGEAIPLGARILAVVDCFDALTSDRPYRRRLPNEEALRLVLARRGQMYDPRVVDTFVRIHAELPREGADAEKDPLLAGIVGAYRMPLNRNSIARAERPRTATARELELEACSLGPALIGETSIGRVGRRVADYVDRVTGDVVCILYAHDPDTDELTAVYVSTTEHEWLRGHRLRVGTGVSGWVAANQETISNADAALDLGDAAAAREPRLRTCVAVPLGSRPTILSVYSCDPRGFSTEQTRLVELAAKHLHLPVGDATPIVRPGAGEVVHFPRVAHS